MLQFQDRVDLWIEHTARSLRSSFTDYWPADEDGRNDPCEQNVTFHLAHVLLREGCSVFAEANHPDKSIQGIDLLALAPDRDWFLAVEAKRVLADKGPSAFFGFLSDIERLERFWLNLKLAPEAYGQHRCDVVSQCHRGYGVVIGLLWVPKSEKSSLLDFWKSQTIGGSSEYIAQMRNKLISVKAYWPAPELAWREQSGSAYHLLAAAFEIPPPFQLGTALSNVVVAE